MRRLFQTFAFRLAFRCAAISFGVSILGLAAVYALLASSMRHRANDAVRAELNEVAGVYEQRGLRGLKEEYAQEIASGDSDALFIRIVSVAAGELAVLESIQSNSAPVNVFLLVPLATGKMAIEAVPVPHRRNRMLVGYLKLSHGEAIQIGTSIRADDEVLQDYRWMSMFVVVLLLVVSAAGGLLLARRAMTVVAGVTASARMLGQGNLSQRVPPSREGAEIDALAAAFNTMADRIEKLVKELREVTNNVAHDLRSPLTRIRGTAEAAAVEPSATERERETASSIIEECDRLIGIINTMLEIAETESGVTRPSLEQIGLAAIARDAHELFQPVAAEKGLAFKLSVPDGEWIVTGNRARLQRMVSNLVDNAIKYTPEHGTVELRVEADAREARVIVSDTGVGMNEVELSKIFDRFYRSDRSRSTPGNGLGLALARAVARAHGGDITVSSRPGQGSTFVVTLPR